MNGAALRNAAHPVAIFANGIGDHFINLPAIRALCALFPGRLTLVCRSGMANIFFRDLPAAAIHEHDMRVVGEARSFDAERVAEGCGPCDLLLSLNPWHSPSVDHLIEFLAPGETVGFFPEFSTQLPLDFRKHSSQLAFDVPRRIEPSLQIQPFCSPPQLAPASIAVAQHVREQLPKSSRLLVVHTETGQEKKWPKPRFIAVLDRFIERHRDYFVLVLDRELSALDTGEWGERVLCYPDLPLDVAFGFIARADLFLGVDSCMLHAADMFGTPGVGLFGPTNPEEFGFVHAPHRHVCGKGAMAQISETEVLAALEELAPP